MARSVGVYGLLLLLLFVATPIHAEIRSWELFLDQSFGDFAEELENARDEGKKAILIFFEMDECPFCRRMRERVLNRAEVQDYFHEHFAIFSIDIEGDVEIVNFDGEETTEKDFAFKENRVRATPVFAFFDLEGTRIARYIGATRNAEEFLWLGEFVADEHYKRTRFTRFKREKRNSSR